MPTDWTAVRKHFPVLNEWVYLNTATFGPLPSVAAQAIAKHFADRDRLASLDFLSWYDRVDRIRAKLGRWIGADADDIAFTSSAGVGLSWILHGLDWKPGDRILTPADEFPNNLYATDLMARYGVEVDRSPAGEGFDLDRFVSAIGDRTRMVLLSAIDYASGFRPPLAAIGEAARRRGAIFVIDGTQGAGAIPLDVDACGADVVICHGYKWMCSPAGAGFLYVRPEIRERLAPLTVSWRSHRDWRRVDDLHHGAPELPSEAAKLEGGVLNFAGLFALEAVVDLFFSIGREELWERVAEMAHATQDALRRAGGEPSCDAFAHFDSPVVAARFPGLDLAELCGALRRQRIAVAVRHGRLRVSPHFFNNAADLTALESGIADYRRKA